MQFELDDLTELLAALAEHLAAEEALPVELVICGGTAMNALGFVSRATRDVDVVALRREAPDGRAQLLGASPLPGSVLKACQRVADDFQVPADWLNAGPADLLRLGLPRGCEERLTSRSFGSHLQVHFLGRLDLICLKLYAWSDTATPRHGNDLKALMPDHVAFAADWVMTHNAPEGFLPMLQRSLTLLGAPDVAARLG